MTDPNFIEGWWDIATDPACPISVVAARLRPDARGRGRVVSGRGLTRGDARARCAMEALERHAAVFTDDAPLVWAAARDVAGAAIDPGALLLFSEAQYAGAAAWNARVAPEHRIAERFDDRCEVAWVEARSLHTQGVRLVPAAVCYLGFPHAFEHGFPAPDSNGLAAGHTVEDATERALLELVERDAVAIWWYSRAERPELPLERMAAPSLDDVRRWLAARERRTWLLDLTHDLGIPVVAAVSCDGHGRDLAFGFAATRDTQSAMLAAVGELVQFEASQALRTAHGRGGAADFLAWASDARAADHRFLLPSAAATPGIDVEAPKPGAALGAAGVDAVVLDLSRGAGPSPMVAALRPRPVVRRAGGTRVVARAAHRGRAEPGSHPLLAARIGTLTCQAPATGGGADQRSQATRTIR